MDPIKRESLTRTGLNISRKTVMLVLAGLLLPLIVPLIQFGLVFRLWSQHSMEVKRDYCTNTCWDTTFKAGYETGAGSYKHVYFNVTWQSGVMWALTLVVVVMAYESTKYLLCLVLRGTLRWRMAVLYLSAVYPHYYAFWGTWNYLNDDFYSQFVHQLLFTITEVLSTLVVLHLADKNVHPAPHLLLLVVGIAGGHVATAGWDQFVSNVLKSEGHLHQVLRDVGFMVPDLLHIFLPLRELAVYANTRRVPPSHLVSNKLAATTAAIVLGIWSLGMIIS